MNELLAAAIRFFTAGAAYFEHETRREIGHAEKPATVEVLTAPAEAAAPAPVAPKRARAPKKEAAAAPAPAAASASAEPVDEQRVQADLLQTSRDFVMRFAASTPDGKARAIKLLGEKYQVASVYDLTTARKAEFTKEMRSLIAEADAGVAA